MSAQWLPILDTPTAERENHVLVGLLGNGIAASRTPFMHMAEGRAQGLDYDYRLIDLADCQPPPEIEDIFFQLETAGFQGLNVTFPYKKAVIPHLTSLSENAQAVGAVNTVVFRDGGRFGHNTDYWGFAESFRHGLTGITLDTVLLIGAGGAGGAVAAALMGLGVGTLIVQDVNATAAERLVDEISTRFGRGRAEVAATVSAAAARAAGIVNTSPMGMEKLPGLPLDAELIEARHWVADIVYFPLETAFLATAREKGCKVLPGKGMAIFQAVRAFELFTGLPADPARMEASFDSFSVAS